MLSLDLLVALCDVDCEEVKCCIRNENGSLNREMLKTWEGGHPIRNGEPKEGAMYLVVDVPLMDCKADLIYSHKGTDCESTLFCYMIDDSVVDL
jgi:hypothetical protein